MKRRPPTSAAGVNGLPPELAAGPEHPAWDAPSEYQRRRLWVNAGTAWSQANGHGWNGWRSLLPEQVRYDNSALGRAKRRAEQQGGSQR